MKMLPSSQAANIFHLKAAELALERLEDLVATIEDRYEEKPRTPPRGANQSLQAVDKVITPLLAQLRQSGLPDEERAYVALIEKNLRSLTDPLTAGISAPLYSLSPTELQVAQLVRDGKTSKEIAALLHLSKSTIHTHRQRIREKIGLTNNAVGLRAYLHAHYGGHPPRREATGGESMR